MDFWILIPLINLSKLSRIFQNLVIMDKLINVYNHLMDLDYKYLMKEELIKDFSVKFDMAKMNILCKNLVNFLITSILKQIRLKNIMLKYAFIMISYLNIAKQSKQLVKVDMGHNLKLYQK